MADIKSIKIVGVAKGSNLLSSVVDIAKSSQYGCIISHPASTTTTYTFQVCDNSEAEIAAGVEVWADFVVEIPGATPVDLGQKSSAADFELRLGVVPHLRLRLKHNTTVGTGLIWAWLVAYPISS